MKLGIWPISLLLLSSCVRDASKERLLETGDTYFKKNDFGRAAILYRRAIQKDQRYGPAYYRLALADLKTGDLGPAAGDLKRAAELLPPNSPESMDAKVKLGDLYLLVTRKPEYLDEVSAIAAEFLARDPNSFDGHRLQGELFYLNALQAYSIGQSAAGKKVLQSAIAEYRKALAAKPGELNATIALARCLVTNGEFVESEKLYLSALSGNRDLAVAYSELYRLYMQLKRTADAETLLKSAAVNNPKEYRYLALLASHYYSQKQTGAMIPVLVRMDALAKDLPVAYASAGDFYLRIGQSEDALSEYMKAVQADPEHASDYRKRMIEVYMRQGRKDLAASLNDEILKKNPKDTDAQSLQASLLLDRGAVQESIQQLQSVIVQAPKNYVARYDLGRALAAHGDYQQARQRFTETVKIQPDYIPAWQSLAQLEMSRGDYDGVLDSTAQLLKIDPANLQASLLRSSALVGLRRYTESENLLQGLLKDHPTSTDVLFQVAVAYLGGNRQQQAEDVFRKLYKLDPNDPRGLLGIEQIYVAQKKPDKAIELLQAELKKSPERMDYHMALANAAARLGKYDLAISEYRTVAAATDPHSKGAAATNFRLGEVYREEGDFTNAIRTLEKARAAGPDDSAVIGALAQALDSAGRKPEARADYELCLKLDPSNGMALNNLAFLLEEGGADLDQALTYAQRAKQVAPGMEEVSDTLGRIYLKKKLFDNAVETFKDVSGKHPKNPSYHYYLGMSYLQRGELLKGIDELQTALKNNPPKDEETQIRQLLRKYS
jgi:tetratricopeptide (TPR) repeat protein